MSNATSIDLDQLLGHATWAKRLAYRLVRDEQSADDLVQEAWEVALTDRPEAGRPVRPWLATVIRNLFRMKHRQGERRSARETAAVVDGPAAAEAPRPADQLVEQLEQQRHLSDLVMALDEPFRTTLLLRYYEGLSAAEIARRLGIPAGTVRWRLQEAIAKLRTALDAAHAGDRNAWRLALGPLADLQDLSPLTKGALPMKLLLASGIASGIVGAGVAATVAVTHHAPQSPSVPPPVVAAAPAPTAPPPSKLGRLDKPARSALLSQIANARQAAARPNAELDKEYIRAQMVELLPLIKECYERGLEKEPNLAGRTVVRFTISGEANIGGLVTDSQVEDDKSTMKNADVRECIQETMYAARFPAPTGGGETVVTYPFVLAASEEDAAAHHDGEPATAK